MNRPCFLECCRGSAAKTNRKHGPLSRLLLVACGLLFEAALFSCGSHAPASVHMTVGVPPLEQNALLYVAAEKNLFIPNGIAVTIKDFNWPAAIAAMVSGTVDIAETAEFPFVKSILNGQQLRILAANDRFENDYLVARRDKGIPNVSSLRDKRIGVALGTITDFYLGRFLALHGIKSNDVTVVNVQPSHFEKSILDGHVDAVVAWQPFVNQIVSRRPTAFAVWPVQSGQDVYGLLVCRSEWLHGHTVEVAGFLKSLAKAEDFLEGNPSESRAIVAKILDYDDEYISSVWPEHEFSLTLDFSLVAAMEDEARWIIADRAAEVTAVPDFVRLIYIDGLRSVRPEGVNLMQ